MKIDWLIASGSGVVGGQNQRKRRGGRTQESQVNWLQLRQKRSGRSPASGSNQDRVRTHLLFASKPERQNQKRKRRAQSKSLSHFDPSHSVTIHFYWFIQFLRLIPPSFCREISTHSTFRSRFAMLLFVSHFLLLLPSICESYWS